MLNTNACLDHLSIPVKNLQLSLNFYSTLLGLDEAYRNEKVACLQLGKNLNIKLKEVIGLEKNADLHRRLWNISFKVDDLKDFFSRIHENDIQCYQMDAGGNVK